MKTKIDFPTKRKVNILSLGAESVGRFALYQNGRVYISENFGDILEKNNLEKFKKSVLACAKEKKPDIILTDLHPSYNSTVLGKNLSKRLKIPIIGIQHHLAHIFSAVGDFAVSSRLKISNPKFNDFIGIAADGTGFGFDENIWGGEVFQVKNLK